MTKSILYKPVIITEEKPARNRFHKGPQKASDFGKNDFIISNLVSEVVTDMENTGEEVPKPIACRSYSGNFMVRVPPDVHRKLAVQAAESGVSLNGIASFKLSQ